MLDVVVALTLVAANSRQFAKCHSRKFRHDFGFCFVVIFQVDESVMHRVRKLVIVNYRVLRIQLDTFRVRHVLAEIIGAHGAVLDGQSEFVCHVEERRINFRLVVKRWERLAFGVFITKDRNGAKSRHYDSGSFLARSFVRLRDLARQWGENVNCETAAFNLTLDLLPLLVAACVVRAL